MPRLHVVEKYHSFAMQRMSGPLKRLIGIDVTFGDEIDESAEINLHMPWHFLAEYEPTGESKHIIVFTHLNRGSEPRFYRTALKADAITVMSFEGRKNLIKLGVDPRKIRVAYCGTDHTQFRKRNVGVVGSKQPNGRKRGHILLDLAWRMDPNWLQLLRFYIIGVEWEPLVEELKAAGLDVVYIPGIDDDKEMLSFYHTFDVLLSTGYEEGGPMPIIEAMKAGVPVLTPDYGFGYDLLTDVDKYYTVEDLEKKLIALFEHDIENARIGAMLTWHGYVEEYAMILNDLLDKPIMEIKNSGTPRYNALMRVIDRVKPKNVLEVGTWSGRRASQMIQRAAGYRPIETILYAGFDLFEEMTEDLFRMELSKIPPPMNIVRRFLDATGAKIHLFKGNSAVTVPEAFKKMNYQKFDLIFIDGGHREDTIRLDWENVQDFIHDKTVIVFDDYYYDRPDDLEGYGCNNIIQELGEGWEINLLNPITTHDSNEHGKIEVGLVEISHA